jgi:hypothetical protein
MFPRLVIPLPLSWSEQRSGVLKIRQSWAIASLRCAIIEKPFDLNTLLSRVAAMARDHGSEAGAV